MLCPNDIFQMVQQLPSDPAALVTWINDDPVEIIDGFRERGLAVTNKAHHTVFLVFRAKNRIVVVAIAAFQRFINELKGAGYFVFPEFRYLAEQPSDIRPVRRPDRSCRYA
jgi:hypothetical protein